MSPSIIILAFSLLATPSWADKTPKDAFSGWIGKVCMQFGHMDGIDCGYVQRKFVKEHSIPTEPRAYAALKVDFALGLCGRDEGETYTVRCWEHIIGRFNDDRKNAEKQGQTDAFKLAETLALAKAECKGQRSACIRDRVTAFRATLNAVPAQAAVIVVEPYAGEATAEEQRAE
jgi:hypothetical protein